MRRHIGYGTALLLAALAVVLTSCTALKRDQSVAPEEIPSRRADAAGASAGMGRPTTPAVIESPEETAAAPAETAPTASPTVTITQGPDLLTKETLVYVLTVGITPVGSMLPTATLTPTATLSAALQMATLVAALPSPTLLGAPVRATAGGSGVVRPAPTREPLVAAPTWTLAPKTYFPLPTAVAVVGTPSPTILGGVSVTYRVTGSIERALVSYQNVSGGQDQLEVTVPWETTQTMVKGDVASLAATSRQADGAVIVEMLLGGAAWKRSESSGPYVTASVVGIVE